MNSRAGKGSAKTNQLYHELRDLARRVARSQQPPRFYTEHAASLGRSLRVFRRHPAVRAVRAVVSAQGKAAGHGYRHARNVALDGGAIVAIESQPGGFLSPEADKLIALVQVAALLHDCRRDEANHELLGAAEARRILTMLSFNKDEIACVAIAIVNHVAFQEPQRIDDQATMLMSDALYDADKFRWGPENFTHTLWEMASARSISPERLYAGFEQQLTKIAEIKHTFRTETGRKYGPEFIDLGLTIGRGIFKALEEMLFIRARSEG